MSVEPILPNALLIPECVKQSDGNVLIQHAMDELASAQDEYFMYGSSTADPAQPVPRPVRRYGSVASNYLG